MSATAQYLWHYSHQGQAIGPIEEVALRQMFSQGQLSASTPVWRQGMADWLSAVQCGLAPPIAPPSAPLGTTFPSAPPGSVGDTTGGLIPYKNPQALTGYYLAMASVIPVLGLFLGPAAVHLGRKGLAYGKANPVVKGVAHAWVAILLGGLISFIN